MRERSYGLRFFASSILVFLAACAHAQALGDLVITPTRIVLDDKTHSSDITLLNRSLRPIRYRLNLVDMEMSEAGAMARLSTLPETSAIAFLRLAPREILLQPGEAQRIKIAAMYPAVPEGEHRSHIAFEPVSTPKPNPSSADLDGLSISFQVRSVVTIPVVVRHGRLAASASIQDAEIGRDEKGPFARVKLLRTGNRSIRGDLNVFFQPKDKAPRTNLGFIAGLPVYVPNKDRVVTIHLSKDPSSLGQGTIEIFFAEPERTRDAASAKFAIHLKPG